jgi:phenylacetate-CoA ligase
VNLFPTQVEELILDLPALAPHFECVLTRPDRLDELTIRVEVRDAGLSGEDRDAAVSQLRSRVKARVGVNVAVELVEPMGLVRSVGKIKRVRDDRER